MEKFVNFMFDCKTILVKFNSSVSSDDVIKKTYEMAIDEKLDDMDYEDVIKTVLNEMKISDYEIMDVRSIDMEYAFNQN